MPNQKTRKGWSKGDSSVDPAAVFRDLDARQLRDLETCRMVWEQEGDPLALCEAIRQSNLPEWLGHALLVMLTDGSAGYPALRARQWRGRTRHATDAARVASIAMVRSHPSGTRTWEMSYDLADHFTRADYDEMPGITRAGLKRTYERVVKGLEHRWRYHQPRPGMQEAIVRAWSYMAGLLEAHLASRRK